MLGELPYCAEGRAEQIGIVTLQEYQGALGLSRARASLLDRFVYDPDNTVRESVISITKGVLRLIANAEPHQDKYADQDAVGGS